MARVAPLAHRPCSVAAAHPPHAPSSRPTPPFCGSSPGGVISTNGPTFCLSAAACYLPKVGVLQGHGPWAPAGPLCPEPPAGGRLLGALPRPHRPLELRGLPVAAGCEGLLGGLWGSTERQGASWRALHPPQDERDGWMAGGRLKGMEARGGSVGSLLPASHRLSDAAAGSGKGFRGPGTVGGGRIGRKEGEQAGLARGREMHDSAKSGQQSKMKGYRRSQCEQGNAGAAAVCAALPASPRMLGMSPCSSGGSGPRVSVGAAPGGGTSGSGRRAGGVCPRQALGQRGLPHRRLHASAPALLHPRLVGVRRG